MLITAIHFFLDILKEIVTVIATTAILSFLNTKKKNHSAGQQEDGSSSDK